MVSGARFPRLDQQAWTTSNVYAIGDQFFYSSGNDADTLLRRSRAVMALLSVALGALVYVWARRLISPTGAWVSLLLFVFSPTLLAHGPLVTSDIAAALFFTAAVGAIWVALHRVTPATVLGAAVLLAGAFLSKLSAPILIPVAIVMTMVRVIDGRPLRVELRGRSSEVANRAHQLALVLGVAVVFGLVTWTLIWASFGFRYTAFAAATTGKDAFLGQISDQPGAAGWFLSAARRVHLLPEAYLYGSALTVQFASERAAFLNGQFSTTGWWWYFPYAFAVKTTIPAMIVGLLALAALVGRWRHPDAGETCEATSDGQPLRRNAVARAGRCLRDLRADHQPQYRSSAPVAGLSGAHHPGGRRGVLASSRCSGGCGRRSRRTQRTDASTDRRGRG